MKLPRDLSGEELVKHLVKHWDYLKIHQVGSHMILQTQHSIPRRTGSRFPRTALSGSAL